MTRQVTHDYPDYDCLFTLMDEYLSEHPEATEDEAYEAACWKRFIDREAAKIDQAKEQRRYGY